jgi:hypothetical protein
MARELTVILKSEPQAQKPFSSQLLAFFNDVIRSPIFVFVFGAGLGTAYPVIKGWVTPADKLALQRVQEQARADAALIAPFIGNLDASKPGQFEAARAALLALEEAASAADGGSKRPVYAAVNKAIEAVAVQLRPPTDKTQGAQIELTSEPVPVGLASAFLDLSLLSKDTLVYVQVARTDEKSQRWANETVQLLHDASILAPGVEKLPAQTMPKRTQIRYYHEEDRLKAEQLAALVSGVTRGEVLLARPKLDAKLGTLEVWFGTGA